MEVVRTHGSPKTSTEGLRHRDLWSLSENGPRTSGMSRSPPSSSNNPGNVEGLWFGLTPSRSLPGSERRGLGSGPVYRNSGGTGREVPVEGTKETPPVQVDRERVDQGTGPTGRGGGRYTGYRP